MQVTDWRQLASCYPPLDGCRPPTDGELRQLSGLIESHWKDVARCLRPHPFETRRIATIECESPGRLMDQSATMLEQWRNTHGEEATVRLLCQSLLDADCRMPLEKVFGEKLVDRVVLDMNEVLSDANGQANGDQDILLRL